MPKTKLARRMSPYLLKKILDDISYGTYNKKRESQLITSPDKKFVAALFLSFGDSNYFANKVKDHPLLQDHQNPDEDIVIGKEDKGVWSEYENEELQSASTKAIIDATSLFALLQGVKIERDDDWMDEEIATHLNSIFNNGRDPVNSYTRPESKISHSEDRAKFNEWKELLQTIRGLIQRPELQDFANQEQVAKERRQANADSDRLAREILANDLQFENYKSFANAAYQNAAYQMELNKIMPLETMPVISNQTLTDIESLTSDMERETNTLRKAFNPDSESEKENQIDTSQALIALNNIYNKNFHQDRYRALGKEIARRMRLTDDAKKAIAQLKNTRETLIVTCDNSRITLKSLKKISQLLAKMEKTEQFFMTANTTKDSVLIQKDIDAEMTSLQSTLNSYQFYINRIQTNLTKLRATPDGTPVDTRATDTAMARLKRKLADLKDHSTHYNNMLKALNAKFDIEAKILDIIERKDRVKIPKIAENNFDTTIITSRGEIRQLDIDLKNIEIEIANPLFTSEQSAEITRFWNATNKLIDKKSADIDAREIANNIAAKLTKLEFDIKNSVDELQKAETGNTSDSVMGALLTKLEGEANNYIVKQNDLKNSITSLSTSQDKTALTTLHDRLEPQLEALNKAIHSAKLKTLNTIIKEMETDKATIENGKIYNRVTKTRGYDNASIQDLTTIQGNKYLTRIHEIKTQIGTTTDPKLATLIALLDPTYEALHLSILDAKGLILQAKINELQNKMVADLNILKDNFVNDNKKLPVSFKEPSVLAAIKERINETAGKPSYQHQIDTLNGEKDKLKTDLGALTPPLSLKDVETTAGELQPTLDSLNANLGLGNSLPISFRSIHYLLDRVSAHAHVSINHASAEVSKFNAICNDIEHAIDKYAKDKTDEAANELFEAARNMLYTMDKPSFKDWIKAMNVYGDTLLETFEALSPPNPADIGLQQEWNLLKIYVEMNKNINKILNGDLKLDFSFMDHTAIVHKDTDIATHLKQNVFLASAPIGMHISSGGFTRHEMLLEETKDISVKYLSQPNPDQKYTHRDLAVCIVTERKQDSVEQTVTVPEMLNPLSILTNAAQQFLKDNPIENISLKTLKSDIEDLIKNMILRFEKANKPYTAKNFQEYISANLPKGIEEAKGKILAKNLAKKLEDAYNTAMNEKTLLEIAALSVAKYMQARGFSGEWANKSFEISNMSMGPAAAQAMADFAAYHKIKLFIHSPNAYRGLVGDPKKIEALIQKDPTFHKRMNPKGQLAELTSASATAAASSSVSTPSSSPISSSSSPALSLSPASSSLSSSPLLSLSADTSSTLAPSSSSSPPLSSRSSRQITITPPPIKTTLSNTKRTPSSLLTIGPDSPKSTNSPDSPAQPSKRFPPR